jgi:putative copper export protein
VANGVRRRTSRDRDLQLRRASAALTGIIEGAGGLGAVIARTVEFAGITAAAGAAVFERGVLAPSAAAGEHRVALSALASRGGFWGCVVILLVAPIRIVAEARALAGPDEPVWPMIGSVLSIGWGMAWATQTTLAAIGAAGFRLSLSARPGARWVSLATAVVLCGTPALMGHAAAGRHWRSIVVGADWVHVFAAGGWVGTLCFLARSAWRLPEGDAGGETLASLIDSFHRVALCSAGLLLATGATSLWLRIAHLRDLVGSAYGALLFAKLVCVGVVASLGAYHSGRAAKRSRGGGPRGVAASLSTEVLFSLCILVVTAMLTGTARPGD